MADPMIVVTTAGDNRVVRWLAGAGLRVVEARTGAAALELVGVEPVDVVVVDAGPPDMSGAELGERVAAGARAATVPVINVADDGARSPAELVATVRAALHDSRLRRAELHAERLVRLVETTLELNSATGFTELLHAAAGGAARIYESAAVVLAETADGRRLAGAAAGRDAPVSIHPWPAGRREVPVGASFWTEEPEAWPLVRWPAEDLVVVASARLRVDRPAVQIAVPASAPVPGAPVLRQLVQAVAAAVEAQRSYDNEHRIAVTLQRSLLPQRLPTAPGVELAVRYAPASRQAEVGGDFYELAMIDNRLLVAIGDVSGHSLHAATVMAELRHAVRAYALDGHPPGGVLERVNRLVGLLLPGETATICLLTLDPVTGRVRLANAGHPPPLIVTGDDAQGPGAAGTVQRPGAAGTAQRPGAAGTVRFVTHHGPLLGVRGDQPPDLEFALPAGAMLVLYTDGLVERRDSTLDDGFAALSAAVRSGPTEELDAFCGQLLTGLCPHGTDDDVAVVAVRWRRAEDGDRLNG